MSGEVSLSEALAPCGHDHRPATPIGIADALTNDRTLLTAIEMGVIGLGEEHDCPADANAVAELVRTLQARLAERLEHVNELVTADRPRRRPVAVG